MRVFYVYNMLRLINKSCRQIKPYSESASELRVAFCAIN